MKITVVIRNLYVSRSETFRLNVPRLSAKQGRILCITGPNGSGKTTLLHCIAGLLDPDRGEITVKDTPVSKNLRLIKALIGYIPDDEDWFIKELCAEEYFQLLMNIYAEVGISRDDMSSRIRELSSLLHFTTSRQPLATLSHGNKKKVQLIAGLMHKPALVVVDEARNGLDPLAIMATELLLQAEAKRGAAIIAATHDLQWAERIASDVAVLVDGSIKISAANTEILRSYGGVEQAFMKAIGDRP